MNESIISTPIGSLIIKDDDLQIYAVLFSGATPTKECSDLAKLFQKQFLEYLDGKRKKLEIPYLIEGTPFQKDVMIAMSRIPYGETLSYKELARSAGYPNAHRAVGTVCRTNPLPFILPCHRVIRSDHTIGLYGGGESVKEKLINLEKQAK